MPAGVSRIRRRRNSRLTILHVSVLLALGCSAARSQPVSVQTAEVELRDIALTLDGIGTVQAFNVVSVRAQVDGVLQRLHFQEGQTVRAGDLLAEIDPLPYQANLDQAIARRAQDEARLQNARLNLQRYLGIGDFASRQQVAGQQASVAQLEAQLRAGDAAISYARSQLAFTRLTAPLEGITGVRLVDEGNLLRSAEATPIVTVAQVQPISLLFTLPADRLPDVRAAMASGPLTVDALDRGASRVLDQGTLSLVDNQIEVATGQIRLKATMPNADRALWPGQFVTARLLLRTERGVPTVPSAAIQRGPDGPWLYVVQADGTATVERVSVRRFANGMAVLDGGPAAGTSVVTAGAFRLTPGARVRATARAAPRQAQAHP